MKKIMKERENKGLYTKKIAVSVYKHETEERDTAKKTKRNLDNINI